MNTTPSPTVRVRKRLTEVAQAAPESAIGGAGTETSPDLRSLLHKIEYRSPSEIAIRLGNPRKHSAKQLTQIRGSLERFGFVSPIVVNAAYEVIAGEGRLLAARASGWVSVPVIRLDHMSEADQRAYRVLENRLGDLAGWDPDLLKIEITYLIDVAPEAIDIGWTSAEIDQVFAEPAGDKPDPADIVPAVEEGGSPFSIRGDLWLCGKHRILCGDAREPADYERLLGGEQAQQVFTDPPYNVPNTGHVTGRSGVREFAMAHGEMSRSEFTAFLLTVFVCLERSTAPGAIVMTCMDWRHLREVLEAGHGAFQELKNICVWAKSPGMGSLYRSAHELVLIWKRDGAPHVNNVELGKHGRFRSNVWTHPGMSSFGRHRKAELAMHPTVKPCALVMDAIKDCSRQNGIILDPFGGSGTTMIAAARTRRRGYLIEYDGRYVDVAVKRWQDWSGTEAVHAETGLTFAQTAERRIDGREASHER